MLGLRLFLVSALLSVPLVAGAQEDSVKTKFYDFDDLMVEGSYKKPDVAFMDARQKVKFDRLLKLKKDFLPKLKATAKDAALR